MIGKNKEAFERLVFDRKILEGILLIREENKCSLHDAIEIFNDIFLSLKEKSPEKFTVDLETYWKGFYS